MTAEANDFELSLPYIVGPNIYELYTDAGFFITKVYVNGIERKLSNPDGQTYTLINKESFSGPMGYYNKIPLNSHMREGENTIKIVFEPSVLINQMINKGLTRHLENKIFAHSVIVRGELKENSLGVPSKELDDLLKENKNSVDILGNKFTSMSSSGAKEITMDFNIDTIEGEEEYQCQIQYCDGSITSSNNFTGELLLNGIPILHINNNRSTTLQSLNDVIKPTDVNLTLKISSINNNDKPFFKYDLQCDMNIIAGKVGLKPKYDNIYFGDFFNRLDILLWDLKFKSKGIYETNFEYYY